MGHFYELDASGTIHPRHFVPMTSRPGESRPTRVTDAKKHGWHPSVTTIQGLLDKPALTSWKIDEHLKQAFYFDMASYGVEGDKPNLEGYLYQIKHLTQTTLDKAPKDGTDFHDVLETYFTARYNAQAILMPDGNLQKCVAVDECLHTHTGIFGGFKSETAFAHKLGYAGKVDLHCAPGWVVDFKTKNSADKWRPKKMAYPEMAMQLAAYRVGLGLDNARCANVFICLEDGAVEFHEWSAAELDKQFANFTDLLRIWLRNAEYVPGHPTSL